MQPKVPPPFLWSISDPANFAPLPLPGVPSTYWPYYTQQIPHPTWFHLPIFPLTVPIVVIFIYQITALVTSVPIFIIHQQLSLPSLSPPPPRFICISLFPPMIHLPVSQLYPSPTWLLLSHSFLIPAWPTYHLLTPCLIPFVYILADFPVPFQFWHRLWAQSQQFHFPTDAEFVQFV